MSTTQRSRAMAPNVIRRTYTAEIRVRSQVSPREMCGVKRGNLTSFSPSTSVSPVSIFPPSTSASRQYHSTNAPYPFIHLPRTTYDVSLPVLQFSPVNTIPPMLHTHSFTYRPQYIMFPFQYFSFPLSVSFHQCSISINSPTTHAIYCFSPSTSVFPCQYHSTNAPYPFIHLPPTPYTVFLPVLQFSLVSTIPPMLRTHSFTYHTHYIMFLSQYFSFPLSVSFHQCSIPIHSPTTHYM